MSTDCRRPLFSRFWLFVSPSMDRGGMRDFRRQLLAELEGDVVEVGAGNGVTVTAGTAERIPCADASADAVVCSLMLCSVRDQDVALNEARRVQKTFDATMWPRIGGGCHMSRDTAASIAGAGFSIERIERFRFPQKGLSPTSPHIIGVAVRT